MQIRTPAPRSRAVIDVTLLASLAEEIRSEADVLRKWVQEAKARAADAVAARIEERIEMWLDEELTVAEAAAEAGLRPDTVRKKIARGEWKNCGRPYRPRIKRRHLFDPSGGARLESRRLRADGDDLVDEVLSSYEDATCE
jgi:hypothetical protein